jgi:hypothetical protein
MGLNWEVPEPESGSGVREVRFSLAVRIEVGIPCVEGVVITDFSDVNGDDSGGLGDVAPGVCTLDCWHNLFQHSSEHGNIRAYFDG